MICDSGQGGQHLKSVNLEEETNQVRWIHEAPVLGPLMLQQWGGGAGPEQNGNGVGTDLSHDVCCPCDLL